jgi:hypothetical protein
LHYAWKDFFFPIFFLGINFFGFCPTTPHHFSNGPSLKGLRTAVWLVASCFDISDMVSFNKPRWMIILLVLNVLSSLWRSSLIVSDYYRRKPKLTLTLFLPDSSVSSKLFSA